MPILAGVGDNISDQVRVAESLTGLEETLDVANATGNADLLVMGRAGACARYRWTGGFIKAMANFDKVLHLYETEKHCLLVDMVIHDPKTVAGVWGSICTLILGYPDQARRLNDERDLHDCQRGHPFDIGYALSLGAHVSDQRYDHEDLRGRAEECERLGRENSLPVLWATFAPISFGQALIREGRYRRSAVGRGVRRPRSGCTS